MTGLVFPKNHYLCRPVRASQSFRPEQHKAGRANLSSKTSPARLAKPAGTQSKVVYMVFSPKFFHLFKKGRYSRERFISDLIRSLSDEHKEVLYYLSLRLYSTTRLAAIRGQSDRNIRKLRMTIQKKLQRRMYEHLSEKQEKDYSLTLREREFMEEYEALLQTMGKDAVIRPENKTPPRKKKAALDDGKDG